MTFQPMMMSGSMSFSHEKKASIKLSSSWCTECSTPSSMRAPCSDDFQSLERSRNTCAVVSVEAPIEKSVPASASVSMSSERIERWGR